MYLRPPRSTRTDPLCPDATRCRSLGRGRVLDELHEVVLVNHLAGGERDVLAEFEGLDVGHLDPEAALAALEVVRSEEHTSELQSLKRISYAVFCLKQNNIQQRRASQRCSLGRVHIRKP